MINTAKSNVLSALAAGLLLVGCGEPTAPVAPDSDDPAFTVDVDRAWSLVANDLTPGHDSLGWSVEAPSGVSEIEVWLDGELAWGGSGGPSFDGTIDVAGLPPGDYELLFAAQGADMAFARRSLVRSHPLYVLVTVDWDQSNTVDHELEWQEGLHADHPALRLTHFVGPYTFTDPAVAPDRVDLLVAWLEGMRDVYDDEIGLHIHPYCNFVETTSVPCRTEPSFVYDDGDPDGYTVLSSAYTVEEYTELLLAADALFEAHGFAKPTSFRAGGWIADAGVLQALANAGYVADTSANNWQLMEEWEGAANNVLWEWNQEHWAGIDSTSQPYYPSAVDAAVAGEPSIRILEVPDNGSMADYVEAEEMIAVLEANWDGGALDRPKVLSLGYHNRSSGLGFNFRDRIRGALDHIDGALAEHDAGPIVYGTLSEMPLVWPAP